MPNSDRRLLLKGAIGAAAALPALSASAVGKNIVGRPIRVGQIGTSHAHATKLSVYRESADYDVVGIVEPDQDRRRRAEKHRAFRDLTWMTTEQLLNTDPLDVVLIETEVRDLLDNAELAIKAGKHVHIDKPAGESFPHFQRIIESARQQQLIVQLGYMYRYNPGMRLIREFLAQGWLGDIFEIHTVMSKVVPPATRRGMAEYPGGIMFELGCHVLDSVLFLLGKPKAIHRVNQHASPLNDTLVDNMLTVLEFDRASATIKSSAQEVEGFSRRQFTVCGTEGTIHIQPLDRPQAQVALARDVGTYQRGLQEVTLPEYTRYVDDAADMARVLRGEHDFDFSYDHDLLVQSTLLEACDVSLT